MSGFARALLALAVVVGCGGPKTSTTTSGGSDEKDCEPGRCLQDIAAAIKEHRDKARACFDQRIAKQPDIQGNRILINFAIEKDGTVSEVTQSVKGDQIEDDEMVACVSAVIEQITFAKSATGKRTRAYHSFEFSR